jgi:hypothetical protein
MRIIPIMILTALGIVPLAAHASEGAGMTSSGSITIRVVIPPIAAALQAQAEGAVGIWTVEDGKSALMINLPSSVDGKQNATAMVYHGSDMPIAIVADANSMVTLTSMRPTRLNGLTRESFSIAEARGARGNERAGNRNGTLVVSAL